MSSVLVFVGVQLRLKALNPNRPVRGMIVNIDTTMVVQVDVPEDHRSFHSKTTIHPHCRNRPESDNSNDSPQQQGCNQRCRRRCCRCRHAAQIIAVTWMRSRNTGSRRPHDDDRTMYTGTCVYVGWANVRWRKGLTQLE